LLLLGVSWLTVRRCSAAVERMIAHAVETFGGLEILVNDAGGYDEPVG
jgi:NAD(P)-dependent dehydrogenase (short-subunit alcohol dehydrogenase family)